MSLLSSSEADFEQMFEMAPVSLWLEDFSGLKQLFDTWRAAGVQDLKAYLLAQPERVQQCAATLKILKVNQHTLQLFAATSQQELVAQLHQVFRDDMFEHQVDELSQLWGGKLGFSNRTVNYALDGRRLDVQIQAQVLSGHEDSWDRVMLSLQDVTAAQRSADQLASSERHARDLFDESPVSLWVEDFSAVKRLLDELRTLGIQDFKVFMNVHPEFVTRCMQEIRVIDVNRQTLTMFAAPDKPTLLNRLGEMFRDEMRDSFAEQLLDLWNGKTTQHREVVNYALSGEAINIHLQFAVLPGHLASWDLVLVSLVDITARKKAEAYLEYLGKHDSLTQLRNRAFYMDELNRLSRKGPWPVSILVIDLNGLKSVNDDDGHVAGDALLRRAGEVLGKAVTAPSCAARIGGDEFAVLLPGADERATEALKDRIESILELNNQFYAGQKLSMAIGMATCHSHQQIDAAIVRADHAMYAAKSRFYIENRIERRLPPGSGV